MEHSLQVELIFKHFGWKISLGFFRLHLFLLLWRNITPELFITFPSDRGTSWILQCFPTLGNFDWLWLFKNWQRLNLSSHLRRVKCAAVTQVLGWTSLKLPASCTWPRPFLFRNGASFPTPCPIHCLILKGEVFTWSQNSVPAHQLSSKHPEKPGTTVPSDLFYSPYGNVGALSLSSLQARQVLLFIQCCNAGFTLGAIRLSPRPVMATVCWI